MIVKLIIGNKTIDNHGEPLAHEHP